VYKAITDKIIECMEKAPADFKMPWHIPEGVGFPTNAATHAEYRGINVLSLWLDAQTRGYSTQRWASYRQWQHLGAQVRKGERGSLVVFYKRIETTSPEVGDHEEKTGLRHVARASYVFNAAQVDGFSGTEPDPLSQFERIQEVEAFVKAVGATIHHGHSIARYRHDQDLIEMPDPDWFVTTDSSSAQESYYSVLLHELTHWSGGPTRLNRQFGKRFGDETYAMEELVAELGAAFMCSVFGISSEPRADHAAYVASWLKVLNRDPKAIFNAASKAQEAFEHLAYLATRSQPST
jgi:antirestriction protein ArdC